MSTTSSLRSDSQEVLPSWKREAKERLAAHRTRRPPKSDEQTSLPLEVESNESRAAQVAARVAARYAKVPSYSEVLAQEAHATALAEQASAQEKSAAAQAAVDGIGKGPTANPATAKKSSPTAAVSVPVPVHQQAAPSAPRSQEAVQRGIDLLSEATIEPVETIAGNLIEFPREIVAPRRARPRLAEGPLREEAHADAPQLRIFEVDAEAISKTPPVEHPMPEWSTIRLDARSAQDGDADPRLTNYLEIPMNTASMEDRLMAALVDLCLASLAFLVFVAVFVSCTAHPPTGKPALAAAGGTLVFFLLLYQYLFFTFSECTPGMRYARIALCTFEDENPTRRQMKHRIGALLLSACTLGMGFAWAWFDEDGLGWHDRLSRTYQRSYR